MLHVRAQKLCHKLINSYFYYFNLFVIFCKFIFLICLTQFFIFDDKLFIIIYKQICFSIQFVLTFVCKDGVHSPLFIIIIKYEINPLWNNDYYISWYLPRFSRKLKVEKWLCVGGTCGCKKRRPLDPSAHVRYCPKYRYSGTIASELVFITLFK